MKSKKVNWIFLAMILLHFIIIVLLNVLSPVFRLGMVSNFILSQAMILIPAMGGTVLAGENVWKLAGFHKIRISTVFMICLFTYLAMPLTVVVNAVSMLFVDNTVAAMSGDILLLPFPLMLLVIGFIAPLSEEFVFRGILYQGYKRSGTALQAILLSALLFSLMHLNFNQAAYAFVIGLIVALLVEATGSLWSSVLFHTVFNSSQVCLMYVSNRLAEGTGSGGAAAAALTREMLLAAISVSLIVAAVTTALAGCVLVWIAKNEKREDSLRAVWKDRKQQRDNMVTVPLLIAVVLALFYMGLLVVVPYALKA
ncbi:MAG: CPBP family intramembrane metalloprotease [Lachnospiraceae bacterium]|nr:CPBP family intramembrane metalloprotease [Lachnospiraceae bacterium]